MARLPIGQRIREHRKKAGTTQSDLAREVGISPSYLNLIEHDKRAIGGTLLGRIARALDVDMDRLSGTDDARLAQDIAEIARLLSLPGLDEQKAARFVSQSADWARAFRALHRSYAEANESALALSERLSQSPGLRDLSHQVLTQITSIRSFAEILEQVRDLGPEDRLRFSTIIAQQSDRLGRSAQEMIALLDSGGEHPRTTSPFTEVEDFIAVHGNHFPDLEAGAERLRERLDEETDTLSAAIVARLARSHGLEIRFRGKGRTDSYIQSEDASAPHAPLVIDEGMQEPEARFQQARRLIDIELIDPLHRMTEDPRLGTAESRNLARQALADYAAAALLFPYAPFLKEAENLRYDIDRLGTRFGGSFPQIAQRLTTLQSPGAQGIPFSLLRADPAGNLSQSFSIPGLRMPRWSGACPLWAVYAAFTEPEDRTVAQLAVLPNGERFLFVARRWTERVSAFGRPRSTFSMMIGCDASYADRIVYGDAFASGRGTLETPVGFNCRSCPRSDCTQRAQPPVTEETPAPIAKLRSA